MLIWGRFFLGIFWYFFWGHPRFNWSLQSKRHLSGFKSLYSDSAKNMLFYTKNMTFQNNFFSPSLQVDRPIFTKRLQTSHDTEGAAVLSLIALWLYAKPWERNTNLGVYVCVHTYKDRVPYIYGKGTFNILQSKIKYN